MQSTPHCSWFAFTILCWLPGCGKTEDGSQALHKLPLSNGNLKIESTESKFSKNNIERFCQKVEAEHPGATEPFLLDYLRLVEAGSFEDILTFSSVLTRAQQTGNVQVEILIALAKKDPQRAFELCYTKNRSLETVIRTWTRMTKVENYGEILSYLLQRKFDPEKISSCAVEFTNTYAQSSPIPFLNRLKELRPHPLFNVLVKENTWTLTWVSPQETLTLINQMNDPKMQIAAMATYGAGILRRANTPQLKEEIYSLQNISDAKLRSAAFAGAYGSMLKDDFQGAIKIIENIQDQGAYDKIIADNLLLLDKKMTRDEVWALVYKVQDPAAKAKLEKLTGLNLSQQK